MADVYQFSPSSQQLLETCLQNVQRPGFKWMQLFHINDVDSSSTSSLEITSPTPQPLLSESSIRNVQQPEWQRMEVCNTANEENSLNTDNIVESSNSRNEINTPVDIPVTERPLTQRPLIDTAPDSEKLATIEIIVMLLEVSTNKLEVLTQQQNYEELLPELSECLSLHCIRKICEDIINSDVQCENEKVVLNFFPVYILKEPALDNKLLLLRQGYSLYPDEILDVLKEIFLNIDIPKEVVAEFFALKKKARLQFINKIIGTEVPPQVFLYHLDAVSSWYETCQKTHEFYTFMVNGLLKNATMCRNDRNYGFSMGKFFEELNETFVQNNQHLLQQLVDTHETRLAKLCQTILNKHINRFVL